jgi:predicted DNA-binding protein (MmcQ/YjbR family)
VNLDEAERYLLGKAGAQRDYPFGPDVAVFKLSGKMFATLARGRDGFGRVNLKCDPHEAVMLRDLFDAVLPGYHMNKTHWNTVVLDGSIPAGEIGRMIDNSFRLVFQGLTRRQRTALTIEHGREAF